MTNSAVAEVEAAERARTEALLAADVETLDRLLADDFRYIHATGRVEGRDSYLASIGAGKNKFLSFRHGEVVVDVHDRVAIASGGLAILVQQQGSENLRHFRYVSVWVQAGAEWGLSLWQSTTNSLA